MACWLLRWNAEDDPNMKRTKPPALKLSRETLRNLESGELGKAVGAKVISCINGDSICGPTAETNCKSDCYYCPPVPPPTVVCQAASYRCFARG